MLCMTALGANCQHCPILFWVQLVWAPLHTCSNVTTKIIGLAQVASWTYQRFMSGSTVGGSSGTNLSVLYVSPTASNSCPNTSSALSPALGPKENLWTFLSNYPEAFNRPLCWIHPVHSTWISDIFLRVDFFFLWHVFEESCLTQVLSLQSTSTSFPTQLGYG